MSNEKIRIVVVDDQAVVRRSFVALINTVADMEVIAEGTDGRQAVELYRRLRPDVLLTDLRMPLMTGVEAIAAIRREFPGARVIVLTTFDGDEDIYRSLQAGAQGYLLKDMFFEELEDAILSSLDVADRPQAATRAIRRGLVRLPDAPRGSN